jgi:class 3 adenylate cyclase
MGYNGAVFIKFIVETSGPAVLVIRWAFFVRSPYMRDLPTGTVTLLFTDIEGSTRLLQQLGKSYAGVLNECRQLLRTAFHTFRGHEVDTQGDAFFVVFARY